VVRVAFLLGFAAVAWLFGSVVGTASAYADAGSLLGGTLGEPVGAVTRTLAAVVTPAGATAETAGRARPAEPVQAEPPTAAAVPVADAVLAPLGATTEIAPVAGALRPVAREIADVSAIDAAIPAVKEVTDTTGITVVPPRVPLPSSVEGSSGSRGTDDVRPRDVVALPWTDSTPRPAVILPTPADTPIPVDPAVVEVRSSLESPGSAPAFSATPSAPRQTDGRELRTPALGGEPSPAPVAPSPFPGAFPASLGAGAPGGAGSTTSGTASPHLDAGSAALSEGSVDYRVTGSRLSPATAQDAVVGTIAEDPSVSPD
jgi:hypothetical protein